MGPWLKPPDYVRYTLEDLQGVRWEQATRAEKATALNAAKAVQLWFVDYLKSDAVSGELAVRLQESNRFMTIDSARLLVDEAIRASKLGVRP